MELNSISLLVDFNNRNRLNKPSPITNIWWFLPLRLRFLLNAADCLPFTILTSKFCYGTSTINSSLDASHYLTYSSPILVTIASRSMCHYQFTVAQSELLKSPFSSSDRGLLCYAKWTESASWVSIQNQFNWFLHSMYTTNSETLQFLFSTEPW